MPHERFLKAELKWSGSGDEEGPLRCGSRGCRENTGRKALNFLVADPGWVLQSQRGSPKQYQDSALSTKLEVNPERCQLQSQNQKTNQASTIHKFFPCLIQMALQDPNSNKYNELGQPWEERNEDLRKKKGTLI